MFGSLFRWLGRKPAPTAPPPAPAERGLWALQLLHGSESLPSQATPRAPAPSLAKPERRLLRVQNREGSVEHYYHFLLGMVAPILLRPNSEQPGITYLVPSCGFLDDKLRELQLPDIQTLPKPEWEDLRAGGTLLIETVLGFDMPEFYDSAVFARLRETLFARLAIPMPQPDPSILVINRGESPDFYQSEMVQNKYSAKLRRSVPNLPKIVTRMRAVFPDTRLLELENVTLRDQAALFAGARVVLAQHGAALTNMVWMQPGGLVAEILPPVGKFADFFSELARVCGHDYVAIAQAGQHEPVRPAAVMAALNARLAGLPQGIEKS